MVRILFRSFSFLKKWTKVSNSYILSDQELQSFIWIKAVDKSGNKTIEKIVPKNQKKWYNGYRVVILTLVFLVSLFFLILLIKKIWKKTKK